MSSPAASPSVSPSICLLHKYYFLLWLIGRRRGEGLVQRKPPQRLVNTPPTPQPSCRISMLLLQSIKSASLLINASVPKDEGCISVMEPIHQAACQCAVGSAEGMRRQQQKWNLCLWNLWFCTMLLWEEQLLHLDCFTLHKALFILRKTHQVIFLDKICHERCNDAKNQSGDWTLPFLPA